MTLAPFSACRRLLRLCVALLVATCLSFAVPAKAQTVGEASNPQSFLIAPADPVAFYQQSLQASLLLKQEKWAEAETLLMELIDAYPLSGATWAQLALALRRQSKHREAISAYERVIEIDGPGLAYPGPSNNLYWIAVSHAALGNTRAALDTLERMVSDSAYLRRSELMTDVNFASLKDSPRFQSIAGKEDISQLGRVEGWRRDIDFLVADLERNNPKGYPIPAELFRRQRELWAAVPKLNDEEVVIGMGRMLNVLERGHTGLWLGDPDARTRLDFRPLPIGLYVFPEGIFVTQGREGHEDLAGAQAVKFGNTDADDVLRQLDAAQSNESPMQSLWLSPDLLARPGVLKGIGVADRADRAELTLKMPDGGTVTRTLRVIEQPDRSKLNPPPNVPTPLFLRRTKEAHWLEPMPDYEAIYAQVNSISADDDETMEQFGLRLRRVVAETRPRNIILDIRHNNGGNSFAYQELLRTLIAFSTMEGHRIYVLIGRNVYSAAGNFSTDLERLIRPIFVGEPTSATGNQWGDESFFTLPYSGLTGSHSGARWQLSHPWDMRRSIVPQVPVQLTAEAYFKGEDPALDAVFRLIAEDKAKPRSGPTRTR